MTSTHEPSWFEQRLDASGLIVEFEVGSQSPGKTNAPTPVHLPRPGREDVETELSQLGEVLRDTDDRIDRRTNESDGIDYGIAVASGVVAGIVDSAWVGELSLVRAHDWGAAQINEVVTKAARRHGYNGDDLAGAIKTLEAAYPFAGDRATNSFGGGTIHHLRDLTHHPSPVGLVASIVMQFTGQAWGIAKSGRLSAIDVSTSELIGSTVPEKLLFGTVKWLLHLISDVAGSYKFAGAGTGLPGPLLSMLHEAGAIIGKLVEPSERSQFMKWVENAFRGTSGVPFDFRTELGLVREAGRQALPVLLNEAIVRGCFFVRRAILAIRAAKPQTFGQLVAVDLRPALPWRNRTITRMVTVATSTFTVVDLLDAAVRAAIASGGNPGVGTTQFVLRVNFVGVARTSVAIGVDLNEGWKRSSDRRARVALMNQQLHLLNARTFYKVGDVWIAASEATTAVHATGEAIAAAAFEFRTTWDAMLEHSVETGRAIDRIRARNPELLESMRDDLDWRVE